MLFIHRIPSLSQLVGITGKIHVQSTASVMINFMGQLDRAMEYPDTWLNIIFVCVYEGVSG